MQREIHLNLILFILGIVLSLFLLFFNYFKQGFRKLDYLRKNIIYQTDVSLDTFMNMWGVI